MIRTRLDLIKTLALENFYLIHFSLCAAFLIGSVARFLNRPETTFKFYSQVHRTSRISALTKLVEPFLIDHIEVCWKPRVAPAPEVIEESLGSRICIFKEASENEKGVIIVKFSELFKLMASTFDFVKLLKDYTLVIEPSWSGYCDPDILFYSQFKENIFVLSAQADDYAFLSRLNSNLVPVNLGPCDWVDPSISEPFLSQDKTYDIVMNANWGAWKRHHVLFRAIKKMNRPDLRIALIGGSWKTRSKTEILSLANLYGLNNEISIFEHIPYENVMEITAKSKVSILLSLKEGSNRAIAESIFCNTPVIILEEHIGGITKNVVSETGIITPEKHLPEALAELLENYKSLQPRQWALENISCFISSNKLNQKIKQHQLSSGQAWHNDLAIRANCPELTYVNSADDIKLRDSSKQLVKYFINGNQS